MMKGRERDSSFLNEQIFFLPFDFESLERTFAKSCLFLSFFSGTKSSISHSPIIIPSHYHHHQQQRTSFHSTNDIYTLINRHLSAFNTSKPQNPHDPPSSISQNPAGQGTSGGMVWLCEWSAARN